MIRRRLTALVVDVRTYVDDPAAVTEFWWSD